MTDHLGEWAYGERAIQAPFSAIVCRKEQVDGVKRAMVGGVVLAEIGDNGWQRWRGTMILIPRMIDKARREHWYRLDQMMVNHLNYETTEQEMKSRDSFWKREWRGAR